MKKWGSIIIFIILACSVSAVDQVFHSSQNIRFTASPSVNLSTWQNPVSPNLINAGYLSILNSISPSAGIIPVANIPDLNTSKITSGTLAVARGGTNIGSYTNGDILYASSASVLTKLAMGASNQVLLSGTNPSWGQVSDAHISGVKSNKITYNSNINLGNTYEIDAVKRIDFTGGGFMYDDGSKLVIGRS